MTETNIDDAPWSEHIARLMPRRYQSGHSGAYVTTLMGLIADTVEQAIADLTYWHFQKHPNSPNDALAVLADETGLVRYAGETIESHRERVNDKWNHWRGFGTVAGMIEQLEDAGYSDAKVMFDLPGSVSYPSTSEYRSQFVVAINLTQIMGTGTESDIVSDAQLATLRQLIRKTKPVQYICREIIITYDRTGEALFFDAGHVWDDEDDLSSPEKVYVDEDALGSLIYETHQPT